MKAQVEWDGYRWVAVPEIGGVTQAKMLDQLPTRIIEVVKLMTGDDIGTDDIDLVVDFPGADVAARLRIERTELDAAERTLVEQTRHVVMTLRENGASLRDIATLTGISHQRVHQILDEERGAARV